MLLVGAVVPAGRYSMFTMRPNSVPATGYDAAGALE
jgi:hypothetical protein